MKFGDFSQIYLGLIFWIVFCKIRTSSGSANIFHDQVLFFFCRKINMSSLMLVAFQSRRSRETFIDFPNNILSIDTGITNLFHYIWRISLIHKILNFTDRLEIRWRHQKCHVTLIINLVFFERSYVVPHSCKVS